MVVRRKESMRSTGNFFCPLIIQKKRVDVLAPATKAIVLAWWASRTHVSPNQRTLSVRDKAHICMKKTPLSISWKLRFFLLS
jgi:hypothetical protein